MEKYKKNCTKCQKLEEKKNKIVKNNVHKKNGVL